MYFFEWEEKTAFLILSCPSFPECSHPSQAQGYIFLHSTRRLPVHSSLRENTDCAQSPCSSALPLSPTLLPHLRSSHLIFSYYYIDVMLLLQFMHISSRNMLGETKQHQFVAVVSPRFVLCKTASSVLGASNCVAGGALALFTLLVKSRFSKFV